MISIIVTHKKSLAYLEDALGSIAEQNYKDIETILVYDGNEDDPSGLVEKYKDDAKITMYRLEGKSGVAAGRNLGLEKAKGEYIMFLDNDDYMCGESLKALVDTMDDDTDIVYGQVRNTWFKRAAYVTGQAEAYDGEEEVLANIDFNNYFDYCIGRYKRFQKVTVLGCLYRKSLFEKYNITFNEEQIYYADVQVMAKLFGNARKIKGTEDAVYVRRRHNDKQANPSLSQATLYETMPSLFSAYREAIGETSNKQINDYIQYMLGRFIAVEFPRRHKWGEEPEWKNEFFDELIELAKNINPKVLKGKDLKLRDVNYIKTFIKGDKAKIIKKQKSLLAMRKMARMFTDKKQMYKTITLYIFQKMPLKENWIVFESFMGRNCSGQPKYIYEYMQKEFGNKYTYIWLKDRKGIKIKGKHKSCKRWSLKYFYYMNRSKYWVTNMRQPLSIPRRDETICLSTWHGTPLKKLVFDMEDIHSANPKYKEVVYKQTRGWDYLISDNPFSTEVFQSCFQFEKEKILESGYPANDPLYAKDLEERAAKIKKKLGIPQDKKLILYAPTWRDDEMYDAGEYKFSLALDIDRLKKEFGDEYVLLLRLHYLVVDRLDMSSFGDFTKDVCNYDDITELYMISDMLITDYSSVFFDYANLKRPILFFMYDLEKYRDVLRGFYLDIEKDLPGPIFRTNDELVEAIKDIDKITAENKEKYQQFYDRFCCVDDGFAAKRVVEKVFK
ncbi:MAG: CDP-glycerol:glycerophosphate glycerophosphotransferase [Lachnospiraceae bacterium]|nr:CDP-glycerol:glycerophosphate glycerophosphotransferase [Lachnospiraceae bacterium]